MISLYTDQEEFIDSIRSVWRDNNRIVGMLPTGGGKTRCAAKVIEGMTSRGMRVCFTVPRISLIGQTYESFRDLGLEDITIMHRTSEYDPFAKITIASIDTMIRRDKQTFDLVIVDECHKRRKKMLEWMEEHPQERYLGLTATPFSPWLGEYYTALAKGKSMAWLIENKRLAPYIAYGPDVPDLSGCKKRKDSDGVSDYKDSDIADIMGDAKVIGNVVQNWLENGENRQTIALCINVLHANHLANEFERCGVKAEVIVAQVPLEEREQIFKRFKAGITRILLSVDALTEGFDSPECTCLINARPTKSISRYLQGFGRVLRYLDGKVALIFDHSGTMLDLGMPEDIIIDELPNGNDGMSEAPQFKNEEKKEKKPKVCTKCNFLKPPGEYACSRCGFKPRFGEDTEDVDESRGLVEIGGGKKKHTAAEKQQFWSELKGWQKQSLTSKKQIVDKKLLAMYKNKFGVWPRNLSDKPLPPSEQTLSYIKSRNIAYAKSKQKAK